MNMHIVCMSVFLCYYFLPLTQLCDLFPSDKNMLVRLLLPKNRPGVDYIGK